MDSNLTIETQLTIYTKLKVDEPVVQIQKGERYREGKVEKARSELNPVTSTSNFEISKSKEPKKEQETRSTKKMAIEADYKELKQAVDCRESQGKQPLAEKEREFKPI